MSSVHHTVLVNKLTFLSFGFFFQGLVNGLFRIVLWVGYNVFYSIKILSLKWKKKKKKFIENYSFEFFVWRHYFLQVPHNSLSFIFFYFLFLLYSSTMSQTRFSLSKPDLDPSKIIIPYFYLHSPCHEALISPKQFCIKH